MVLRWVSVALLSITLSNALSQCPDLSVVIIAREGQTLDGSVVTEINSPFTNGSGQMGFVIGLDDGRYAVWYDDGVVFTTEDALPELMVSISGMMGIGDNGQFVIGANLDGVGAIWGQDGLIMRAGDPPPDYEPGFATTYLVVPSMSDDGSAYWIAGTNDGMGGDMTFRQILYRRTPDGTITGVLRTFDFIGAAQVNFFNGLHFEYAFSGNGAHRIIVFDDRLVTPDLKTCVGFDDTVVARVNTPTGQGDRWENFNRVVVNGSGRYLFTGDTDGDPASDGFLASNDGIELREGMMLDGITLGSGVRNLSINDNNEAVFIWTGSEQGTLFHTPGALDLASAVLTVGEVVRSTGKHPGDWIVTRLGQGPYTGPGLDFAEDGRVLVKAELESVEEPVFIDAIIMVTVPPRVCHADLNGDCVLDFFDVQAFLDAFAGGQASADLNADGQFDFFDIQQYLGDFASGCL